jgi:hypothetical protein
MCPVCLATALLIAGSAISSSGLAAIAIKRSGVKDAVDNDAAPASPMRAIMASRARMSRHRLSCNYSDG